MMIKLNHLVPNFSLDATDNQLFNLSDYKGKNIVLYFYPKDNTPGCTTEGNDFRLAYKKFEKCNTEIFGISRDTLVSHEKFKCNQKFPFTLLSDPDEKACRLFDVIKEKNMYGKKVMGIQRSTFLIDQGGKLVAEWRNIKVPGHVATVLAACQNLNSNS